MELVSSNTQNFRKKKGKEEGLICNFLKIERALEKYRNVLVQKGLSYTFYPFFILFFSQGEGERS